jgi:hypothetical protein
LSEGTVDESHVESSHDAIACVPQLLDAKLVFDEEKRQPKVRFVTPTPSLLRKLSHRRIAAKEAIAF